MDIHEAWNKALKETEIIRSRVSALATFNVTQVPYILLSESSVNDGDTVVRRGEISVDRPSLILPPNIPQFEGFDFNEDQPFDVESMASFLLVRGVHLPSMKYDNKTYQLDIFEGDMDKAIKYYLKELQQKENVSSGLLTGPEEVWQFSLLIFICSQIARNSENDIRRLIDEYKKNGNN